MKPKDAFKESISFSVLGKILNPNPKSLLNTTPKTMLMSGSTFYVKHHWILLLIQYWAQSVPSPLPCF